MGKAEKGTVKEKGMAATMAFIVTVYAMAERVTYPRQSGI